MKLDGDTEIEAVDVDVLFAELQIERVVVWVLK
jgi:hypothetical protein